MINGEIRRQIAVEDLAKLVDEKPGAIDTNARSKATHAIKAIEQDVPRIHLIDGRAHDSLLNEIFSNEGIGTLIYGNDYQQIRQASRKDVRLIYNLTRNSVRKEELVHRTLQSIEKNIDRFYVFEIDENIIACIWDFDKTLIPGYMQAPLFEHYKVNPKTFWKEVNALPQYYQKNDPNKIPDIDVNAKIPDEDRRVPFQNMIYIADGPSDIPVFSIVNQFGGRTFAVYKPG